MAEMKVHYKGAADRRILPAEDLKLHGVDVDEDLVFDRANLWSMTLDVNEKLENILRGDGAFSLDAVTDNGGEANEADATVTDDTADKVVMPDGQTDTNKGGRGK